MVDDEWLVGCHEERLIPRTPSPAPFTCFARSLSSRSLACVGSLCTGRKMGLECTLRPASPFPLGVELAEYGDIACEIGERGTMDIGDEERECRSGWEAAELADEVLESVTAGETARRLVGYAYGSKRSSLTSIDTRLPRFRYGHVHEYMQ